MIYLPHADLPSRSPQRRSIDRRRRVDARGADRGAAFALSAGADWAARAPSRRVRDRACAGAGGPEIPDRQHADRGTLRPCRGRRRHQRAFGSLVLPQGDAAGAHSDPRQPRRLRRPRQAQRIPPRWPDNHRLWRQRVDPIAEAAMEQGRQGPAARSRRRGGSLRDRVRSQVLFLARPVARRVLFARRLRPRRPGDRRRLEPVGRRRVAPREPRQAGRGFRQGLSHFRRQQGADHRAVRRQARSAGRQVGRRQAQDSQGHELSRLSHQDLRLERGGGELLSGPHAWVLRPRLRRGAGRGRARAALSGICRIEAAGRRQPGVEGALHLSFSRRQCVARTPAGARAGAWRGARSIHGRCGAGSVRLRQARPARSQCPHPPRFDLRQCSQQRRQGANRLRSRRQAPPRRRRATPCWPAST